LRADIRKADMAGFSLGKKHFDGAYCTVDTFRHLLSEKQSISHLRCVAQHLKRNGKYILGLHLLPDRGFDMETVRWESARGRLRVHTTMTVLDVNRKRREETLRINLKVGSGSGTRRYRSEYKLRTYTPGQFLDLLGKSGCFDIKAVYDHSYNPEFSVTLDNNSEDVVLILGKKHPYGNGGRSTMAV